MSSVKQKPLSLQKQRRNPQILVVEDETIIAMDLKVICESFGFGVCGIVSSGEESIKAASIYRPDVVLMDLRLRGKMSGLEAARMIHDQLHIPIIYLTAYGDETTLKEAVALASCAYIRKPFLESEVKNKVRALL